jgi:hypothetical protein
MFVDRSVRSKGHWPKHAPTGPNLKQLVLVLVPVLVLVLVLVLGRLIACSCCYERICSIHLVRETTIRPTTQPSWYNLNPVLFAIHVIHQHEMTAGIVTEVDDSYPLAQ